MSTVIVLPDVEALVGGWLTASPLITGMDARVAARTPDSMTRPWVRVTLLTAEDDPASQVEYLVDYGLQLDCYAGSTSMAAYTGRAEAGLLARRVRAVLKAQQGVSADGVVVTRVRFPGFARLPDTAYEPARERYVITVEVLAHALPA